MLQFLCSKNSTEIPRKNEMYINKDVLNTKVQIDKRLHLKD